MADLICRWVIAVIFLVAAIPKLLHPSDFSATVGAYGLLPDFLVTPVALLLPPLEILMAVGLLFNKQWGRLGIFVFLLIFILVLGYGIHLGLDIDCGCFGPEDPEHDAFSGLRTALVRDLVMLVLLVFSTWFSSRANREHSSIQFIQSERKKL